MNILLIAIVVYCSGYYYSITTAGRNLSVFALAGVCIVILLYHEIKNKGKIILKSKNARFALFYVFALVVSSGVHFSFGLPFFKQILVVCTSLLISCYYDWEIFRRAYVRTMTYISIFALVGHLLRNTQFAAQLPIVTNYNGERYISGVLFSLLKYSQYPTVRLHGLFWEPGLMATYLLFAILFCRPEDDSVWRYRSRQLLFIVCTVLTKSGAGLMLLPIAIIVKWQSYDNRNNSQVITVFFIVMAALMGLISPLGEKLLNSEMIDKYVVAKVFNENNVSNYARVNAITTDLRIFFKSLPFGTGVDDYAGAIQGYSKMGIISSGTSTLTSYLAQYGIMGCSLLMQWMRCLIKMTNQRNAVAKAGIIVIVIAILSKEPHGNLLFMNCLLMYSCDDEIILKPD